jgi:alpha-L-rhamnosidase
MNRTVGFKATFRHTAGSALNLRIAASSRYRAFLNGALLGYGPTRGPHGHYRVDVWPLPAEQMRSGNVQVLAIEVAGYNVNSFDLLDQPAFLQAEVATAKGGVLAATGADGAAGFAARLLPERVQRVQRYSFQRAFSEAYRRTADADGWRVDAAAFADSAALALLPEKRLLPHHVPLPRFETLPARRQVCHGHFHVGPAPESPWRDRSLTGISPIFKGFPEAELETTPSLFLQRVVPDQTVFDPRAYDPRTAFDVTAGGFRILDFGEDRTGLIGLRVDCTQPTTLHVTFDEILSPDGDVDFKRMSCVNAVEYVLQLGTHDLLTFEPYTLRYLKLAVTDGACRVGDVHLREIACPDSDRARFHCSQPAIDRIFEAARETCRQNAVDVFMDCPSRERAGWLCDSFFTARTALDLTGHTRIEDNFLENFLLPEVFPFLPAGMLPMCYPSDHNDGTFIPNWALWFVMQLEEYAHRRGGNPALVARLKPRVLALFAYLKQFQNSDGLLEKLPSWVFVEWSAANDFVQDVNYPTNMLFAGALDAVGRLYGLPDYTARASAVRATIRKQSFDGEFFVDNAKRGSDGALVTTRNRSETCQYYAFFFDVATPETHAALQQTLLRDFGPDRAKRGLHPEIHAANAFVGNYLRLELLGRSGRPDQILQETVGYFSYMCERTGTLWENDGAYASCNHGFASHVAHVLLRDIFGVRRIDHAARLVHFEPSAMTIDWCVGSLPMGDQGDAFSAKWFRVGGTHALQIHSYGGLTRQKS